ncbi:MAG TPA: rhodanese-like domain-containing protein [Pirellulales bacterium]|nr:rhodanese-like domain-containing protein [Pirellulales bacterium]
MFKARKTVLFLLAALLPSTSLAPAAEPTKDSLPKVRENVEKKKAVLADVREKAEWDEGHVEGAVFLPLSELKAGVDAKQLAKLLPKNKIVYTHCAVGKRALVAGDILTKLGYEVRCLKPGYDDLLEAGFKKAKD